MAPNICQSSLSLPLVVGQTFDLEQIERGRLRTPASGRKEISASQKGQILEGGSKIKTFIAIFMASFPMAITLPPENDSALFPLSVKSLARSV